MVYFADAIKEEILLKNEDLSNWIRFCLVDTDDYTKFTGIDRGLFTLKISKRTCKNWAFDLGDFLGFEQSLGRRIILEITREEFELALGVYAGRSYEEKVLRDGEPTVLIHSTSWWSWGCIEESGFLKSWHEVKREFVDFEGEPIGAQLGDLVDYRDFIMFSDGHVMAEVIVASKQKGYIEMDIHQEYETGARLYFDAEAMARDGLLIRDGAHLPKVKDSLKVADYLIWVSTWVELGLVSQVSTPAEFTNASNARFDALFGERFGFLAK